MSEYRTIAAPAQASMREKMSKFIAFAFPAETADDARRQIAAVANDYHDARHVCWAYMLGADCSEFQWTDNGEPSGTAGKPILGQIRSLGLTNVAVAVVRYFGGIKLGTSGLIAAYRESARLVLEEAEKVTRYEMAGIDLTFPYLAMNDVMRTVKDPEIRIANQEFDNTCRMTLEIRADHADSLRQRLSDIDEVSLL
ncbi:MAG: IMPACT family protein [Bacteroides sp.]|nr:IMPACT family protein [Bacteroides sp.]MCM1413623.1 IMPACT family protein [Bacteroides sp.]MCM1471160.1 IMPACT family protein [Bacteroides sp.]